MSTYSDGTLTPRTLERMMPPQNLPTKLKQIRLMAGLSKTAIIRALNYKASAFIPVSHFAVLSAASA